MEYELTPEAIELGLGVALPAVLDLGQKRQSGRGERDSPSRTQRPGPFLLINRTGGRTLGKESA
jgi:hypothetical protein